jgi:hypothetical protein
MPFKNEAERKAYNREQMRKRRAALKAQKEGKPVEEEKKEPVKPVETPRAAPSRKGNQDSKPVTPPVETPVSAATEPSGPDASQKLRIAETNPIDVAEKTRQMLDTRGWDMWKCTHLIPPDIIVIVKDESVTGYPEGYPVYTEEELAYMADSEDDKQLNWRHKVKVATQGRFVLE